MGHMAEFRVRQKVRFLLADTKSHKNRHFSCNVKIPELADRHENLTIPSFLVLSVFFARHEKYLSERIFVSDSKKRKRTVNTRIRQNLLFSCLLRKSVYPVRHEDSENVRVFVSDTGSDSTSALIGRT